MTDWNEVVRQYGPSVWRTAWRLLGNHADLSIKQVPAADLPKVPESSEESEESAAP